MEILQETCSHNNEPFKEREKMLGADCSLEAHSQHAHCGKVFALANGALEETSLKSFFVANQWQVNFLTDYILREHHQYFYEQERVLFGLLKKALNNPRIDYALLQRLDGLFQNLCIKITAHFLVEKNVLFPHIRNMVDAEKSSSAMVTAGIKMISVPINALEIEHDEIKVILKEIQLITNHFEVLPDMPGTQAIVYQHLKELHEKLTQHIYLENNILYPSVLLLEKKLMRLCLL